MSRRPLARLCCNHGASCRDGCWIVYGAIPALKPPLVETASGKVLFRPQPMCRDGFWQGLVASTGRQIIVRFRDGFWQGFVSTTRVVTSSRSVLFRRCVVTKAFTLQALCSNLQALCYKLRALCYKLRALCSKLQALCSTLLIVTRSITLNSVAAPLRAVS